MDYVVYHIASTKYEKTFDTCSAAKRSATCMNRKSISKGQGIQYAWATIEYYEKNVVHMVERTNLLSGKKYTEASNTPNYCSPSSEAYWSM